MGTTTVLAVLTDSCNVVSVNLNFSCSFCVLCFFEALLTGHCVAASTIAGRYTLSEPLDYIFDHHTDEEERGQETDCENGLDEEVSEAHDGTENNPDQEMTDEEEFSDDEHGHAEAALAY